MAAGTGLSVIDANAAKVAGALLKNIDTLAQVLPVEQAPKTEWYIKRALMTLQTSPDKVRLCTAGSVAQAVVKAAELGLPIDGKLGYFVPFKNGKLSAQYGFDVFQAVFMPSYLGLVAVAKRTRQISHISCEIVHAYDDFDCGRDGNQPFLKFHPAPLDSDRGDVIGAFAVLTFPDKTWDFDRMTKAELDRIRAGSKDKAEDSIWNLHTDQMYLKTVIRRGVKRYCTDPGYTLAEQADDAAYAGVVNEVELKGIEAQGGGDTSGPARAQTRAITQGGAAADPAEFQKGIAGLAAGADEPPQATKPAEGEGEPEGDKPKRGRGRPKKGAAAAEADAGQSDKPAEGGDPGANAGPSEGSGDRLESLMEQAGALIAMGNAADLRALYDRECGPEATLDPSQMKFFADFCQKSLTAMGGGS